MVFSCKYRHTALLTGVAALAPLAAQFGPTVEAVAGGLDAVPAGATSLAFRPQATLNV